MTPRELVLCAEGYRWRDDRVWEKTATLIAFLLQPWAGEGKTITPQQILDAINGKADEAEFEKLAGVTNPDAVIDAMLARQAENRKKGLVP